MVSGLSADQARELYERKLREICTDEDWEVFHRRLHPELYPPKKPTFWQQFRACMTFSSIPGHPDY